MASLLESTGIGDYFWAQMSGRKPPQPVSGAATCSSCQHSIKSAFFGMSGASAHMSSIALRRSDEVLPTIHYDRLSNDGAIRLLNIEPTIDFISPLVCSLEELDFQSSTEYSGFSALSYRWGEDSPIYPIMLNSQKIYIRKQLWNFLKQARENGWTSRIWVDALCMNQNDISELNSQVPRMGEIYTRASNVLVWLGILNKDEQRALSELEVLSDEIEWRNSVGMHYDFLGAHFSESGRAGIRSLICNPYWNRKWIIQEIRLSTSNASLVFGQSYIALNRVRSFFVTARMLMRSDLDYRSQARVMNALLPDEFTMCPQLENLRSLITKYKDRQCGNPKDHVYGLLGLSNSTGFKVDYNEPLVNLYWRAIEHGFSADSSENVSEIRCFSAILKDIMELPESEILKRWRELIKNHAMIDLWAHQFAEAVQLSLGELSKKKIWKRPYLTGSQEGLAIIDFDYQQFVTNITGAEDSANLVWAHFASTHAESVSPATGSGKQWILDRNRQRDATMAFYSIVEKHHPSGIAECDDERFTPQLGDYFIGVVNNIPPSQSRNHRKQHVEYQAGSKFIIFSMIEEPTLFSFTIPGTAQAGRRSTMNEIIFAVLEPQDIDIPLQEGDHVCGFSGHQAALVIRRISDELAICGTVTVRFNTSPFRRSRVQIFVRPHSVLKISNWDISVGKPFLRMKEHCTCKPGQGGCI